MNSQTKKEEKTVELQEPVRKSGHTSPHVIKRVYIGNTDLGIPKDQSSKKG